MRDFDLSSLEIFRAVAAEGSVSRAAVKLNRVQSNVSTRIKQLEQSVDKTLFLRQNRRLTLTADGELLLSYADRLLQLSQEASEALNADEPSGTFRIGAMESTAAARLPDVLSSFHRSHGQVEIDLTTDTAGGLMKSLVNRDIEVAFLAEPVSHPEVMTLPVFEEALVLVMPGSYPSIEEAGVAALSGKTVIAFETGCAYRRYLQEWLLEEGIAPSGVMSVGSYLAILACVAAGTGFAIVPRSVLDAVSMGGNLRLHPLPGKLSRITTLLAWRSDYRSVKLEKLKEALPLLQN